ncbi:hypothetical protein AYI69_g11198 [Smittium culicis]|uniref:Uncharacterized protein n=1 Tax=Smittium culicis TaxID=133412 RepID=A0A1R1X0D5_9FUNG|nr:hypothetical protein AYI69_g11198 [Smittium culicis]
MMAQKDTTYISVSQKKSKFPLFGLPVYTELIEANTSIVEDFFRTPLSEEEIKEILLPQSLNGSSKTYTRKWNSLESCKNCLNLALSRSWTRKSSRSRIYKMTREAPQYPQALYRAPTVWYAKQYQQQNCSGENHGSCATTPHNLKTTPLSQFFYAGEVAAGEGNFNRSHRLRTPADILGLRRWVQKT